MGYAEAKRLAPFFLKNSREKMQKLARITDKVEIIPEVYMNGETREGNEWRKMLAEGRKAILELDQEFVFKGNESINELNEIYERLKRNDIGKIE